MQSKTQKNPPVHIPKYAITGTNGFHTLEVTLKNQNESVLADPGSMIFMTNQVQKGAVQTQGFRKMFGRLFAGQDLLLTEYRGPVLTSANKRDMKHTVAFSHDVPCDIIAIPMKQGDEYRISRGSFLACTEGIEINATLQWKGLLGIGQDEGFVLPKATCTVAKGVLWISSFGQSKTISLRAGESVIIDNGVFLACKNDVGYGIVKLGKNLFQSWLGGEGFGMQFVGPAEITTQSKSLDKFVARIMTHAPPKTPSTFFSITTTDGAAPEEPAPEEPAPEEPEDEGDGEDFEDDTMEGGKKKRASRRRPSSKRAPGRGVTGTRSRTRTRYPRVAA